LPVSSKLKIVLFSVLVAAAVGVQFSAAYRFQLDWKKQNQCFTQLISRAPSLEPDALIIANDSPFGMHSYTGSTFALNWLYSQKSPKKNLDYAFIFGTEKPSVLLPERKRLNYLSAVHFVNHERFLFVFFDQNCLQVLDPEYPYEFPEFDRRLDAFSLVSNPDIIIQNAALDARGIPAPFQPVDESDFCVLYNKADLARQKKDWNSVISFLSGFPGKELTFNSVYFFPLIEAYAHTGQWEKVVAVLEWDIAQKGSSPLRFEDLWEKIEETTPDSPDKENTRRIWKSILDQYIATQSE
jgi:hypothetical protein